MENYGIILQEQGEPYWCTLRIFACFLGESIQA